MFDPRRYDLAKVYLKSKLALKNRVKGQRVGQICRSPLTGEIVAKRGRLSQGTCREDPYRCGCALSVGRGVEESRNIKILSNMMVDLQASRHLDSKEAGVTEQVYYPVLRGS